MGKFISLTISMVKKALKSSMAKITLKWCRHLAAIVIIGKNIYEPDHIQIFIIYI
jgi:hypothetical protein